MSWCQYLCSYHLIWNVSRTFHLHFFCVKCLSDRLTYFLISEGKKEDHANDANSKSIFINSWRFLKVMISLITYWILRKLKSVEDIVFSHIISGNSLNNSVTFSQMQYHNALSIKVFFIQGVWKIIDGWKHKYFLKKMKLNIYQS